MRKARLADHVSVCDEGFFKTVCPTEGQQYKIELYPEITHTLHLESEHFDRAFHKTRFGEKNLTHITSLVQPLPCHGWRAYCLLHIPRSGGATSARWDCHQLPSR